MKMYVRNSHPGSIFHVAKFSVTTFKKNYDQDIFFFKEKYLKKKDFDYSTSTSYLSLFMFLRTTLETDQGQTEKFSSSILGQNTADCTLSPFLETKKRYCIEHMVQRNNKDCVKFVVEVVLEWYFQLILVGQLLNLTVLV